MIADQCGNCRFWLGLDLSSGNIGYCRRNPPKLTADGECPIDASKATWFPVIADTSWCGKYEPTSEKILADTRAARVKRGAIDFLDIARDAVKSEAKPRELGWDDFPVADIYRGRVARHSKHIAEKLPDLELEIRALARDEADHDPKLIEMLAWAALDTTLAEVAAR